MEFKVFVGAVTLLLAALSLKTPPYDDDIVIRKMMPSEEIVLTRGVKHLLISSTLWESSGVE